jgi:lysophospholipase L1-like esterase
MKSGCCLFVNLRRTVSALFPGEFSMRIRLSCLLLFTAVASSLVLAQTQPAATRNETPATAGSKPTLWLIGDSTMNNNGNGGLGWAAPNAVGKLFDPAKLTVQNKARGGRSARSYYSEGLWTEVKNALKPGDYVLMAFGHNDGPGSIQQIATQTNGRPDLAGTGEETAEGPASNNRGMETVHTFGWYMNVYVKDSLEKGATPIMGTMIPHNAWDANDATKMRRVPANTFGKWSSEIALKHNIYFIDINNISATRMEKEGRAAVTTKYFTPPNDGTHTNPAGAMLNAESAVMGIKALKELKLNDYLSEEGKKLEAASEKDVRRPDPNKTAAPATAAAASARAKN